MQTCKLTLSVKIAYPAHAPAAELYMLADICVVNSKNRA